ncbi:hypothetical protein BGP77_05940 [Saccharospirillum sp. MSK14-1]|uniref:hypothetical protein n=1 Tax=Saccharospirillum sp. MSK14-1 TaxID=1897632 RepID=UPI000D35CB88|nr:hypothetical protein [Saccharospirillum sp. MSK14-1]PTY36825.1 hypothetical protein BGP77_05940 [Saccharospirillum sp. MSK14-1]
MSTPTWNPIDRLTAVTVLVALVVLAVLAAPVATPLLAGLLIAQAQRAQRLDLPAAVLVGWAWAGLAVLLLLAAGLWGWPLLLEHSARFDALLVAVDLAWLEWLLGRSAGVSVSLLTWLLLFPAGFMLAWLGSTSLSGCLARHHSSGPSVYRQWALNVQRIVLMLVLQLGGRLLLFSLVFWGLGIEAWWLLAVLLTAAAILPTLPLVLAMAVVWLSEASPQMFGLLTAVAVIEAGLFSLAQRGPRWARHKALFLLLVGSVLIVSVAALGSVGVVLAVMLLAAATVGVEQQAASFSSATALTEADDPVGAIDESMRQEDS